MLTPASTVSELRRCAVAPDTGRPTSAGLLYVCDSAPGRVRHCTGTYDPAVSYAARGRLTARQAAILGYVAAYVKARGRPPTLREIGAEFGIRSTNGVTEHLWALEKKGYLVRETLNGKTLARGLRLATDSELDSGKET